MTKTPLTTVAVLIAVIAHSDLIDIAWENDCFHPFKHSDDDYSNGIEVRWWHDLGNDVGFTKIGLGLQQNMYTPSHIDTPDYGLRHKEHPWCGYAALNAYADYLFKVNNTQAITFRTIASVGILGKWSAAGATQRFIHKVLGCHEPRGWDQQIPTEVTFNMHEQVAYNWTFWKPSDWLDVKLIPNVMADAGTFKDRAGIGCDLKFDFFDNNLVYGDGVLLSAPATPKKLRWIDNLYFLAGITGYYVAHDTTLDGSLVKSSNTYHVKSEHWLGDAHCAIGIIIRNFNISYRYNYHSKEYTTQTKCNNYGSIAVGCSF